MLQFLIFFAFVIPLILFLVTQQSLLSTIKKENRVLAPGLVWLQLIPIFGLIWQFIVVYRISISIRNQILAPCDSGDELGLETIAASEKTFSPTFTVGIAYCILLTFGIFLQSSGIILNESLLLVQFIVLLTGFTCWIIYWVKISRFKQFFRSQHFLE